MSRSASKKLPVFAGWLVLAAIMFAAPAILLGDASPKEVARVTRIYESARETYQADPGNVRKAWEFGRACFDRAEVLSAEKVKASVASEGIAACREAIKTSPANAPSHYYLGLNLGQLAQTKTLGALKLVRQMEDTWLTSKTLDEPFDFAGADRSLGILYSECPRPPLSIGSREKARRHLELAVKLAPDHPENRIYFAEMLLKWDDRAKALEQLEAIDALWDAARKRLTGEEWQGAWETWPRRVADLRKKLKPEDSR